MKPVLAIAAFLTIIATPALAQTYDPNMGQAYKIRNFGQYESSGHLVGTIRSDATGVTERSFRYAPLSSGSISCANLKPALDRDCAVLALPASKLSG
jgi:hypothetical protein